MKLRENAIDEGDTIRGSHVSQGITGGVGNEA
jgi:hypothetical protein